MAEAMILEPAVTLTDYALAIENAILGWLLCRSARQNEAKRWLAVLFVFIGLAALLGGTVHGFLPDSHGLAHEVLWRATIVTIGLVALAAAMAAAAICCGQVVKRLVARIAIMGIAAYCIAVLFFTQEYRAAIIVYLPATVFLLASFVAAYMRRPSKEMLSGAAGMALTLVAAVVQQSRVTVPVLQLDHNALYHIIQAIALLLVYVGAREVVPGKPAFSGL